MGLPVCEDQSNSWMGILLLYGAPALLHLQEVNCRPIEIDPRIIYSRTMPHIDLFQLRTKLRGRKMQIFRLASKTEDIQKISIGSN
jgi:hypothetical protein